jgi:hypothetical protein
MPRKDLAHVIRLELVSISRVHTCAVHTMGRLIGQAVTPTTCPGLTPPGETVDASLSRSCPCLHVLLDGEGNVLPSSHFLRWWRVGVGRPRARPQAKGELL